jgi:hypothetical protein
MNALPTARLFNIDNVRKWLSHSLLGSLTISGPGANTWGFLTQEDQSQPSLFSIFRRLFHYRPQFRDIDHLVIPRSSDNIDGITLWVMNQFVPFIQGVRSLLYQSNELTLPTMFTEDRPSMISTLGQNISHFFRRKWSSKAA